MLGTSSSGDIDAPSDQMIHPTPVALPHAPPPLSHLSATYLSVLACQIPRCDPEESWQKYGEQTDHEIAHI